MMSVNLRPATTGDAAAIAAIYAPYVRDSVATFELEAPEPSTIATRIGQVQAHGLPWLVAECDGQLHGYAYATTWKPRAAYDRTVETTIYLGPLATGQGLGRRLYAMLLDELQRAGLHALLGGIALPNAASVGLHEALGFTHVGTLRQVGFKCGRWVDVGYWQKLL